MSIVEFGIQSASRWVRQSALWGVILALQVLRPVWKIRLAKFRSEKLGHFISEADLALALLVPKQEEKRSTDVFFMPSQACNEQLRTMYLRLASELPNVRTFDCRSSRIARLLLPVVSEMTLRVQTRGQFRSFFCGSPTSSGLSHTGLLTPRRPKLTFTQEEINKGWEACARLGLSPTTPYICIHVRDEAYLKEVHPHKDWSYHDYRNPELCSYEGVVRELLDEGFWVVRMGRVAERKFPTNHARFIDYPFCDEQSDLLDVFLYAHAQLGIAGSASGIDQIGYAFDVPAVVTNLIPFEPFMPVSRVYVCPVLLRNRTTGDVLGLEEMLRHNHLTTGAYERHGIEIQRNSPEEISCTVREALDNQEGDMRSCNDQQSMFWTKVRQLGLFDAAEIGPPGSVYATPKIGAAFLNAHWNELMSNG